MVACGIKVTYFAPSIETTLGRADPVSHKRRHCENRLMELNTLDGTKLSPYVAKNARRATNLLSNHHVPELHKLKVCFGSNSPQSQLHLSRETRGKSCPYPFICTK